MTPARAAYEASGAELPWELAGWDEWQRWERIAAAANRAVPPCPVPSPDPDSDVRALPWHLARHLTALALTAPAGTGVSPAVAAARLFAFVRRAHPGVAEELAREIAVSARDGAAMAAWLHGEAEAVGLGDLAAGPAPETAGAAQ